MSQLTHVPTSLSRRSQWLLLSLLLAPLVLALPIPGKPTASGSRGLGQPIPPPPDLTPAHVVTPTPIASIRPVVGMAINAHHISDLDLYLRSVDTIHELGANALIVLTPMWMERVDSNDILFYPNRCPTNEQLIAILHRAKAHDMHTTLLPIVLLRHAKKKEWRGVIEPDDWDIWWTHYHTMMDRFIGIARAADVDMLGVGSELNTTESQLGRWQRLIRYIRTQYAGELVYSSNWDRYDTCPLWDLVDVMGVSSYFELERDDDQAPHERLVAGWIDARRAMLEHAADWKKPLVITEVGYPTVPWATAHPWNYVTKDDTPADHDAQARGYRAFFEAWRDVWLDERSPALGFYCYHWDPYHSGGPADHGYGVVGKPSLGIIRAAFDDIHGTATTPAPVDDDGSH